jgi:hypothetical protein
LNPWGHLDGNHYRKLLVVIVPIHVSDDRSRLDEAAPRRDKRADADGSGFSVANRGYPRIATAGESSAEL